MLRIGMVCHSKNMCHPKTCYELAWCAILKMCNSETCFRLALHKLCHGWMQDLEAYKLTQGEKKWGQILGFIDCNDLKDIISALDITKFAQCEFEECFKMAHILEWHTMPIWKRFQDCTVFVLIATHAPISAHPSYFEAIIHKTRQSTTYPDLFMKLT